MNIIKSLIFLLLFIAIPFLANAQKQSAVTLKNGTELIGVIKSIDPTDALTIVIADVETTIKMADVAKIQEVKETAPAPALAIQETSLGEKDKLLVTDNADYPETFDLKVGNESIKMILVRGGDMNMGFDGKGSRSMRTEPVHKVGVTSFYMSENFITSKVVSEVIDKSSKKEFYVAWNWEKANQIVEGISKKTGLPVRLPTEAEWEYAACSSQQDILFHNCRDFEFIFDLFDEFKDIEYRVDPTGPKKGSFHVIRAYERSKGKLDRSDSFEKRERNNFRLVIKAEDVIDKMK